MSTTPSESSAATPQSDEWIGRVLDERYRIEEFVAEGGMGVVYIAEHLKLRKRVALKVIHKELVADKEVAARFAREAMASAQLDHPHVASALDFGALPEGGAYLVMQLAKGESLAALVEAQGALPWPRACEIGAQIADALAAAHRAQIVHRDLKPDNVLVQNRDDGSVLAKVLDFGIARVKTEGGKAIEGAAPGRALTRVGTVMGTPGYMAPEQAMGDEVDHRADLYALGVCLWELLVGHPLYDSSDLTQIVTQQLTEKPMAAREAADDDSIPEELDELVTALLSNKPDDRPGSASVVRDLLRQLSIRASITGIRPVAPRSREGLEPPVGAPKGEAEPATDTPESAGGAEGRAPTMLAGDGSAEPSPTASLAATAAFPRPPAVLIGCAALAAVGLTLTLVTAVALVSDDEGDEVAKPMPAAPAAPAGGLLGAVREQVEEALATTPEEVLEKIETLQSGHTPRERRRAARWLEEHEPASDVPDWALATASLVNTDRCLERKAALERIVALEAEEALPTIERMHRAPRNGCGRDGWRRFGRGTDCFRCMREELHHAIEELGGDPDSPPDEH